jgi:hypothetical protein
MKEGEMKFFQFAMFDIAKAAELAKASDKVWSSPPQGIKILADYVCLGIAFPGTPPNTVVSMSIVEAKTAEALTAATYPMGLVGATVWNVPVMEMPVAGVAGLEKKLRR